MTKKQRTTVASPGTFEARLRALSNLPPVAGRDGAYNEVRDELVREEREALEFVQELQALLTSVTHDARARDAGRLLAQQADFAGYARGYRAGLRAARRLTDTAHVKAGRAVEGLQREVVRLNDEVARLKKELDEARAAREKKVRSVRKDGVHVPDNADEARRVARNIEEFLKVADDHTMDLEEIRARLPEEANVRDALHHLLLARRVTLNGTALRLTAS